MTQWIRNSINLIKNLIDKHRACSLNSISELNAWKERTSISCPLLTLTLVLYGTHAYTN